MSQEHNSDQWRLGFLLQAQLGWDSYEIRTETRLRLPDGRYYVPDTCVVPLALLQPRARAPRGLEVFDSPLPLVIEVWSPSTGEYDVEEKLRHYQERGDLEIWRVHPYDETITTWVREPDGRYTETFYAEGSASPRHLPGVTVTLADLFR